MFDEKWEGLQTDPDASSDAGVLVTGEAGTGKELVARSIHRRSGRASRRYVAKSVAEVNEGTISSELFGHEKGAFTAAVNTHKGWFEQAHGGTLFLDEVGELPLPVQAKLLRVLEYGVAFSCPKSSVEMVPVVRRVKWGRHI